MPLESHLLKPRGALTHHTIYDNFPILHKLGKDYNTPLDSDHWLRWKKMVEYLNPGGQDAETEKIS
jgi:hypothetical protein